MAPLIGITTYAQDDDGHFMLPRDYSDCVRKAGGIPVHVPPGETRFDELLAKLDGIIIAGGGDLDPSHYGGEDHDTIYGVDAEKDTLELELARRVIDCEMPTLAICRGSQIINVAQGGTIIPHLPDVVGDSIQHRLPPGKPIEHPVRVVAGSRLASILQATEFSAASWHHQAIDQVGRGLTAVADAADGTIEALEMPDHPWLIALQWHPEITAASDPIQQRVFADFIRATMEPRGTS